MSEHVICGYCLSSDSIAVAPGAVAIDRHTQSQALGAHKESRSDRKLADSSALFADSHIGANGHLGLLFLLSN